MKIKSITASYQLTLNLGDYNGAKVAMSATADIEDGDDEKEKARELFVFCRSQVCQRQLELLKERQPQVSVTELFQGKKI
ncbi:MAG: hypothetical protein ACKO0Z_12515, partial [Betaproteobacteria bacterium]